LLLVGLLALGCQEAEPSRSAREKSAPGAVPILPPQTPERDGEPHLPALPATQADIGVGEKGRDYPAGPVSTPVRAFWATKEAIAFRIQIPKAMELFKATAGRGPRNHEEFMEKIVQENHVALPELPTGYRYQYDPKSEQLMVIRSD
jgi:hypothetical protein